jgi:hypothetical protein
MLRMTTVCRLILDDDLGLDAHPITLRPTDKTFRRPLLVFAMGLGHILAFSDMAATVMSAREQGHFDIPDGRQPLVSRLCES